MLSGLKEYIPILMEALLTLIVFAPRLVQLGTKLPPPEWLRPYSNLFGGARYAWATELGSFA